MPLGQQHQEPLPGGDHAVRLQRRAKHRRHSGRGRQAESRALTQNALPHRPQKQSLLGICVAFVPFLFFFGLNKPSSP